MPTATGSSTEKSSSSNRILVIGASGYFGKHLLRACISMGHPTFAYVRPVKHNSEDPSKLNFLNEFRSLGVTFFQGELDDTEKLVSVVGEVDVVISALAVPQHLDQLKIITAIKQATNNIKRFVPSEFGNEADRVSGLPPFQAILENKKKIRRVIEAAGIPYTYVSSNSFAAYFVDYLLHPRHLNTTDTPNDVTIYGNGEAKAVLNYEEDVAVYTVKAATDERAANRVLICWPQGNIVSQLDLVSSWEKKTGQILNRIHIPEQQLIQLSLMLPFPENVPPAILHNIFIKGDQMSFRLTEDDLEASKLYPDYKYTSVNDLLDICLVNPPKPKLASF
ncbi:hypothetical protein Vadar_012467 [Vaccinium darrowii]|uniref:Uncharacterized protein n=1 Tax=Vaccinium darrowii TaxID=229202 RepID=A0ACB7YDS0_9ERIC|nr:hypothetical protein Vadar_012467 [Vaccinium darrowii]